MGEMVAVLWSQYEFPMLDIYGASKEMALLLTNVPASSPLVRQRNDRIFRLSNSSEAFSTHCRRSEAVDSGIIDHRLSTTLHRF